MVLTRIWENFDPWVSDALVNIGTAFVADILTLLSRFRRTYTRRVYYDHRFLNLRGLRTKSANVLELEQIFVIPLITSSHPRQTTANPLIPHKLDNAQPIWTFLQNQKQKQHGQGKTHATALAIIGPPGCGKTTLLQHIALVLATNQQKRHHVPALVPLFLHLRHHAEAIADFPSLPLADLAQRYFSNHRSLNPPPQWFARKLDRGDILVLLDGLDEVSDTNQRQAVSAWVDNQIRSYPRARFIVTARPQGYEDAPLEHAHVLQILPFSPDQSQQFIHSWYLSNEIFSSGKDDDGVHQEAKRGAQNLIHRINQMPALTELTVNPLLLTIITMIHNYRGPLPGRRAELYGEICDVFLGHWHLAKGIQDPLGLSATQKRKVLEPLAAHMMNQRVMTTDNIHTIIATPLKAVGIPADKIPEFLSIIQRGSGLPLEQHPGTWSFAQPTFQEYLCAAHWKRTQQAVAWTLDDWKALINDPWWHETLRLYAAQADATALIQACLELDTVEAWTLAAEVTEEALQVQKNIREKVVRGKVVPHEEAIASKIKELYSELDHQTRIAALSDLTRGFSHELGQPLTNIRFTIQMQQKKLAGSAMLDPVRKTFESILAETERMGDLIQRLALITSTKRAVEPCNLAFQIQRRIAANQARLNDPVIEVSVTPTTPLVIHTDPVLFDQIINNLLLNAIDAIREKPDLIHRRVDFTLSRQNNTVTIQCSDTGVGIPQKHRGNIFDPFFTTKAPGKGEGLGLFIVWNLLKTQGGGIALDPHYLGGTRFIVTLPEASDTP